MFSKVFQGVSVVKENNTPIKDKQPVTMFRNYDIEAMDFISKLDKMVLSEGYEKISYHLGNIDPNKVVGMTDKLVRFRIQDYVLNMIPFLTDQNLLKLKNIILGSDMPEIPKKGIIELIDAEINMRYTPEYTKILFFRSDSNSTLNEPFSNYIIYSLYKSSYDFDCTSGCKLDEYELIEVLKSLDEEEKKYCRQYIYELLMALYTVVIRQAENLHRMGSDEYRAPDFKGLVHAIASNVISLCSDSELKVAVYTSRIIRRKLETIKVQYNGDESGALIKQVIELMDELENAVCIIIENTFLMYYDDIEADGDAHRLRIEYENEFADKLLTLMLDENSPEAELEQVDDMLKMAYVYESKVADKMVKGAVGAKKVVRKGSNVIRTASSDVKKVSKAVGEIPTPFTNMVKNTYDKFKEMDATKRREAIVTGGFKGRLIRLIRLGFKLAFSKGLWSVLGPVYGSIAILAQYAIDGKLDHKQRTDILKELEMEKKIVDEKLDDARSDNDKKAKYELMRIQAQLDKELRRIRLTI